MPSVQLVNLTKKFGRTIAVQNINLKIEEGELLTLLGPSGCGKTTTLRCIAGFVRPDRGEVYLDGKPITHLPPERRGVGIVFQNYALWPHMTIYDNLAFGLQMRKISKSEIKEKIEKALATIRLEGFEKRYPRQLSGSQQQRVAIRPEHIKLFKEKVKKGEEEKNILRGEILQASYLGNVNDYRIKVGNWVIRTSVGTEKVFKIGETVYVTFSPENIVIIPEKTGS